MLARKALAGTAAAPKVYVEDVFSTYLYTGTGSAQTFTNNLDLSGKGGMVWIKRRDSAVSHYLADTERGTSSYLSSNTNLSVETGITTRISAFNNNGFSISTGTTVNNNGSTFVSWSFRQAEKFFDVVTYSGNSTSGRAISHSLGSTPGCIIVRRLDGDDWFVYHRSLASNNGLRLNKKDAASSNTATITAVSSTTFTVGTDGMVNVSGSDYVAYLFAHDAGGFGDAGSDNIITCGSYTGNGSGSGPTVTLGYEPQWVLIKNSSTGTTRWTITDNMRGFPVVSASSQQILQPDTNEADNGVMYIQPTSTGFRVVDVDGDVNTNGNTYIYIAIRRGPMKTPTSGTSVYSAQTFTHTNTDNRSVTLNILSDMLFHRQPGGADFWLVYDRLRGSAQLQTQSTAAEVTASLSNEGYGGTYAKTQNDITASATGNAQMNSGTVASQIWQFARAPGFFDVVYYKGTGSAGATTNHNLGVSPELVITRVRDFTGEDWIVTYRDGSSFNAGYLNSTAAFDGVGTGTSTDLSDFTSTTYVRNTSNRRVNSSSYNYVAYLFASLSGVSKVGSYTGNGSSVTVTTNFQPRFILVKRTDSTGDWIVSDSVRGLVSGNDPYLELNTIDAEVTNEDWVDVSSTGFTVNQTTNNANVNTGTYIYLCIA